MEKLALALITASRKLRPYFQAHSIEVLTNFSLKQVPQRTDVSGRLLKWVIELSEFDILFRPRHAIKGQTLTDFVAKFAKTLEMEATMEPVEPPMWKLFVDGSSGEAGSGTGILLESPEGHKLNCLRLAKEIQVKRLLTSSDSQLVVSQVNGNFTAKDSNMVAYLKLVLDLVLHFERFELIQVPRLENTHANALSKFASSKDSELLKSLSVVTSSWSFVKWGIDFIGPLPKGRGSATFAIFAIDYFTKWVEAEPFAKITEMNTIKFIWKHIIFRFDIPHSLVPDNGRQFNNKKMRDLCDELGIKKDFSMPHHPQANGKIEAVNKTIKHTLKRKLDTSKGAWVDELPHVLWAIRTTSRTATGETPFSMTYGAEAMRPIEVGVPSHRRIHFNEINNDDARMSELHFLEERRDTS
ncbi:uncharacterized protein LOC111366805 [Olea europaea var. sylvestris]|uniref:uncharacterized protein LOC111366805 n=1 Tax=Olea europaea var. sylvestris TaxID=158386 RepID=UPI000C1CD90A|nr:uncharacterized protein LOC111366805 [Olea europaea var. sylvestris]